VIESDQQKTDSTHKHVRISLWCQGQGAVLLLALSRH